MVRLWPVVVLPDGASPSARAGRKWLVAAQDPLKATLWDPGALPRAQWDPVPAVEPPVPPHQLQALSALPAPQVCQSEGKHWTDWFMGWEKEGCAPQSPLESWYPGLFIRHSSTRHEATWHVRSLKLWLHHSCISGTQTHVGLVGEMPQFWYGPVNICLAVLFFGVTGMSHIQPGIETGSITKSPNSYSIFNLVKISSENWEEDPSSGGRNFHNLHCVFRSRGCCLFISFTVTFPPTNELIST